MGSPPRGGRAPDSKASVAGDARSSFGRPPDRTSLWVTPRAYVPVGTYGLRAIPSPPRSDQRSLMPWRSTSTLRDDRVVPRPASSGRTPTSAFASPPLASSRSPWRHSAGPDRARPVLMDDRIGQVPTGWGALGLDRWLPQPRNRGSVGGGLRHPRQCCFLPNRAVPRARFQRSYQADPARALRRERSRRRCRSPS